MNSVNPLKINQRLLRFGISYTQQFFHVMTQYRFSKAVINKTNYQFLLFLSFNNRKFHINTMR